MIPVFYSPRILASSGCFSPSASKPESVVEDWKHRKFPIDICQVIPVSPQDISLAHDPNFVSSILACQRENGFGNRRKDVAHSLPFTTGALLCAAREALESGIACAPVSGFHHAGHSSAAGFCTFNGLMVTALKLLREKKVKRVLVLDLDQHYGNGTDEIKRGLGLGQQVTNCTFGRWYDRPEHAVRYLNRLHRVVRQFPSFDLILFQAGADVHVDDPLGGVLDSGQIRERDRIVFEAAKAARVPLAWDLAGGYQEPISSVVRIHRATMEECVKAYEGTGHGKVPLPHAPDSALLPIRPYPEVTDESEREQEHLGYE
jgi:acetoin utilization deacetylase AcuC-like enzyme